MTATGPIRSGISFSWKTGGTNIRSQVQLFEPERRLSWTGTALTAKAIHVWELKPETCNQTLVSVKESMDGPWMAMIYPPRKLTEADTYWLMALKRAAEQRART